MTFLNLFVITQYILLQFKTVYAKILKSDDTEVYFMKRYYD